MSLIDPSERWCGTAAGGGAAGRTAPGVHIGVLGQFGVQMDGVPLRLRGDKRRAMLAALILGAGRTVPAAHLIERVWGTPPSPSARSALQVHVTRVRAILDQHCGTPLITGGDGGYRVDLAEDQCDLLRFRGLVRRADNASDPSDRADLLIRALALWRGPVLADIVSPVLHERDVPPLTEELLRAAEEGFGAALARGDHERVADQIAPIATDHPEREPLIRVQMVALYRSGRPSEALRVYARTRDELARQLGARPGRELQETFHGVLRGDLDSLPHARVPRQRAAAPARERTRPPEQEAAASTGLAAVPGGASVPERVAGGLAPAELPSAPTTLVGREGALAELDRLVGPGGSAPESVLVRGPAGAGSSALALRWAHAAVPHFPDGQLYVDLRGEDGSPRDPVQILRRLVRSLSTDARGTEAMDADEAAARVRTLLAHRRVLLVLDNATSARQVRPLLPGSSGCAALVTSRYRLTDLLVRDGLRVLPVGPLAPEAAVEVLRAHTAPDQRTESALRRLAGLAGCLPLALRMAAVWFQTHPRRSAEELVRLLEEAGPARGGAPTARMAAVLRAGPREGGHGRGEVPAGSHPPDTSVGQGSYVRLSRR